MGIYHCEFGVNRVEDRLFRTIDVCGAVTLVLGIDLACQNESPEYASISCLEQRESKAGVQDPSVRGLLANLSGPLTLAHCHAPSFVILDMAAGYEWGGRIGLGIGWDE